MANIKSIFSSQYPTKALGLSYSVLELNLTNEILKLKNLNWRDTLLMNSFLNIIFITKFCRDEKESN